MTKPTLEFGLLLHTRHVVGGDGKAPNFEQLWRDANRAEEAGFNHIWVGPGILTSLDRPGTESLITMAALATKTAHIKIGVIPLLPALWNPVLLAHGLATLDVISGGRIILGVGVAPLADHIRRAFQACGVPYEQKAGRLSESVQVMRLLWKQRTASFRGKYYAFDEIGVLPKPVRPGGIPIWMTAGNHDNAIKRVVRLADGWFTSAGLEEFLVCRKKIEAYAASLETRREFIPAALYAAFNVNENE